MLRPLLILNLITALGLGCVTLLPKQIRLLPSALRMEWPERRGDWVKVRDTKASAQEINILAADTRFLKAEYTHVDGNLVLDAGVVLGGEDPNNSIHRPERCLVAQGHAHLARSTQSIALANGRSLPVTRLYSHITRDLPTESGDTEKITRNFLTYYWFVGHGTVTGSHYIRTLRDMQDRLFLGANQRWAYITVAVALKDTPESRALAVQGGADTPIDKLLQDFIQSVIPDMIDFAMIDQDSGASRR